MFFVACCSSDSRAVIILHCICTSCFIPSVQLGFSEPASVSRFTCKHLKTRAQKNGCWSTAYVLEAWQDIKHVLQFHQTPYLLKRSLLCLMPKLLSEGRIQLYCTREIFLRCYACLSEVLFTFHWHLFSVRCVRASLLGHNDWGVWA